MKDTKTYSKLARIVEDRGVTREWIARQLGVSRQTMYSYLGEFGDEKLTVRRMRQLVKLLHMTDEEVRNVFFGE